MSNEKKTFGQKAIRYAGITVMCFVVLGIYGLVVLNTAVFSPMAKGIADYSFEDFYYQILASTEDEDTSRIVTIVDMTALHSRRDLAKAIDEIAVLKPRSFGIDVVFEGLKEDTIGDMILADVARRSHAVYSYKIIDNKNTTQHSFFVPDDSIREAFTNMPRNLYGGMKRSLPIGREQDGKMIPSFVKEVADTYAGQETTPLAEKALPINFSPLHFEVVNYDKIMEHPELITDRVVLLGAMKEENDMHYTPVGKIAGTELLAYAIETLLKQNELIIVTGWPLWLISFLLVLLTVLVKKAYTDFAKSRPPIVKSILSLGLFSGLVVFFLVAIFVWVAFILFSQYNISLNLAPAIAATAFIFTATELYDTIINLSSKKKAS